MIDTDISNSNFRQAKEMARIREGRLTEAEIIQNGVDFICNCTLGEEGTVERLWTDNGQECLILTDGTGLPKTLKIGTLQNQ